jgi:transposase
MNAIQGILTERVDDIPLLLEQMRRMGLPALLDDHFPAHGNWRGLSLGWVTTIWLSSILSRGDHQLVHVEPWVAQRLWTLRIATGQAVERLDFTDDHLETVLQRLNDAPRWADFESALNQQTVRIYELPIERIYVDSTSPSAYTTVSEDGLFQFGHSKNHRPDLLQIKVIQAALNPLGMPLATNVVSGAQADDTLYLPYIEWVQASVGRRGLLYVGDCKMASRETRALIAGQGDFYLCPLPQLQHTEDELEETLKAVWSGEQALRPTFREQQNGEPELIAEGYERQVPMSLERVGQVQSWLERRLVVRSVLQTQAAEMALRARAAKAMAQVLALNHRDRSKKHFEEVAALRQAAERVVQRYSVEQLLWLRYTQHPQPHAVLDARGQRTRVEDRHATVEVRVDEEAIEEVVRRLGWRMYGTNQPAEQLSLEQAVLAYRSECLVEQSLDRLKGCPLSLRPMYVQRENLATGLIRLLSIALRVLTLLEYVGCRRLEAEGAKLAGLYAANPTRVTARPMAEHLLEAFRDITLTISRGLQQPSGHLTSLSPLHLRILDVLGFSAEIYTKLCNVSAEPT